MNLNKIIGKDYKLMKIPCLPNTNTHHIKLIIILLVIGLTGLKAQETIINSGGSISGNGGSVSYSIGQVFYKFNSAGNGSEAQGIQQPYEISVITAIEGVDALSFEIIVYPNPATDHLNLKVENYETNNLSYRLYNINGTLLENRKIEGPETDIVIRHFTAGTYFLKVIEKQGEIRTFKIIKK
ncbi:MAG: T9SS type A sorting domain-containing protein [Bacteroidales bacterium]|nr:T9SS type A sorting domain-containing protein [Bacteroidales bacterium]